MTDSLDLQLEPSMRAPQWLFWLRALPLVVLPLAMRGGWPLLAVAGSIGLSWLWLRRHPVFGHGPRALVRLLAQTDGAWRLRERSGREVQARLLDDSYVQSLILVLNFRDEAGRRRTRVLLGDEIPAEALRRLRLYLSSHRAGPRAGDSRA
mgnify:CR=1 FL=1